MRGCNEKVSGGAGMTNAISVKDRLKKQAVEDGKTMQDKLVTFGLERLLFTACDRDGNGIRPF